jgi:hypothetical protein
MPVLSTAAKIIVVMFVVIALHATRYSSSEMDTMDSDIEYESIQVSTDILSRALATHIRSANCLSR